MKKVGSKKTKRQQQHRVSQMYLKRFGYRDVYGKHWISALDIGKTKEMQAANWFTTDQLRIKHCTVTDGEFDMVGFPKLEQKFLEEGFGKAESTYPLHLEHIAANRTWTDDQRIRVLEFMATLLVRSKRYRRLMQEMLDSPQALDFLRTMCMWLKSEKDKEIFVNGAYNTPRDQQLNFVCAPTMHYIASTLSTFEYRVFETPDEHGWHTCDDPVVMWTTDRPHTIISLQTEVFFPLSRDYALHLCHSGSKDKSNSLRTYPPGVVSKADESVRHIFETMSRIGAHQYMFFNRKYEGQGPIELGDED